MQLTLKTISEAVIGLQEVSQIKLPSKTAYRVSRIIGKLETELKPYEVARKQLLETFGEDQGDGSYKMTNMSGFQAEVDQLLEETVEVDVEPITLEMLGDVEVSARSLLFLGPLLKE